MSIWVNQLDLQEIWEKLESDEISIVESTQQIVVKLNELLRKIEVRYDSFYVKRLKGVISDFEDITDEDQDQFNYAMSQLYDWGDVSLDGKFGGKKMCWIKTIL